MKRFTLPLSDAQASLENVGGKGVSLAKLAGAGLPVPDGFHITTEAYRKFVGENDLQCSIDAAVQAADLNSPAALEAASAQIARLFTTALIPADLADAICAAYRNLPGAEPAVAVRSSATAEDLPGASFAGQQETYLNISGAEPVLDAVRKCWASLWTARAIAYRARQNVLTEGVALAVVVQLLVEADAAGILFTANPVSGNRGEAMINASWGLGEAVVGGAVTPDTITVQKANGKILHRHIAVKQVMTARTASGTVERPVPERLQKTSVLSDQQARELVRMGVQIETLYGLPMDVEWVLSKGKFAIVQARPITALPPEWKRPHPKAIYARGSFAEHLPNPVTPLFGTLGLRAVNTATAELGSMLKIDPLAIEYQYRVVNGYVFMGFIMNFQSFISMINASFASWRMMMVEGTPRWQKARAELLDVLSRWRERDLSALTPGELLSSAAELYTQLGRLYTVIQSGTLPTASSSEIVFTRVHKLARRKGDPEATALLFGYDTAPILAEKSLYDLAIWVKQQFGLANAFRSLPVEALVASLHGQTPEDVDPEVWAEWRERFNAHLETHCQTAYDIDFAFPTPVESPAPLLDAIKMYLNGGGGNPYERQAAAAERREECASQMLRRLKWPLKGWFKKSLGWAQRSVPVREDSLNDMGIANPQIRAILGELGRRFAANGAFEVVEEIYWLEEKELAVLGALLEQGKRLPDQRKLIEQRKAVWEAQRKLLPPAMLPERHSLAKLFPWNKTDQVGNLLKGYGASAGRVTATARVLLSPDDFGRMKPGDVLVAVTTTPAWTPLFAMASAVVTDIGGPLSHSSIVAREYGIPAVLATGLSTRRIQDGQMVTVDGGAGTVALL